VVVAVDDHIDRADVEHDNALQLTEHRHAADDRGNSVVERGKHRECGRDEDDIITDHRCPDHDTDDGTHARGSADVGPGADHVHDHRDTVAVAGPVDDNDDGGETDDDAAAFDAHDHGGIGTDDVVFTNLESEPHLPLSRLPPRVANEVVHT
jgi:hypothetical protein